MPDTVGVIPIVTPHVNTALIVPSDSHMHVPNAVREPPPNPVLDPEAKDARKSIQDALQGLYFLFFFFLLSGHQSRSALHGGA